MVVATQNYYEILGVNKTASKAELKESYRNLAKKYHPDVSNDFNAKNNFIKISEAYAVLSDDDKRHSYDLEGYEAIKYMPKEELFKNVDLSSVLKGLVIANYIFDLIFDGTGYKRSSYVANTLNHSLKNSSHKRHRHGKKHNSAKESVKFNGVNKSRTSKSSRAGKTKTSKSNRTAKARTSKSSRVAKSKTSKSHRASKAQNLNSNKSSHKRHRYGKKRNGANRRASFNNSNSNDSFDLGILSTIINFISNLFNIGINGKGYGNGYGGAGAPDLATFIVNSLISYFIL